MSSEWYEVSLGEFAEINPRRTISKGACAKFIDMAALPIYGRDINNKDIALREFTSGGAKFRNGDTLIARITPCLENGKTAFVSCLNGGEFAFGSTEFIVLGPKSVDDSLFLYYLARSEEFRTYAISRMEGTSGRQRVPNSAVAEYRFLCPPPTVRSEIGRILGGIDDRIALLRETNGTLEAIAQALFKSWFVDFDPVHANAGTQAPSLPPEIQALFPATFTDSPQGPIPAGWDIGKVEDLMELAYGKALKATDRVEGEVPVYGSGGITGSHNQALVSEPSIIVGRKGTVGSLYWEDRPFFPIDTVFYVKSAKPLSYCFYLLQTLGLHDMNTDGAVPGLNRNNVYRLPVAIPSNGISHAFDETVTVIRESIFNNNQQVLLLASLRDTLLPRLISGQLRLPEAEQAIAAITD